MPLADDAAPDAEARMRSMVAEHFDFVWRTARRFGLRDFEADDATQRAFIVASQRLGQIEPTRERSFLFAAAIRIASEIRRTHARRAEVDYDERRDPAPLQDELVERRRARVLLDEIVEAMPDDVRVVFVLFELEQLTMAEIAALVGVPQGTIGSRLRRAREIFERKIGLAQKRRHR
jgi:RNA polymerase sigma-70 factor (ECF subfamily)